MRWVLFGVLGLLVISLALFIRASREPTPEPLATETPASPPAGESAVPALAEPTADSPDPFLPDDHSIIGVVLGPDDLPIEGAQVRCLEEAPFGFPREPEAGREIDQTVSDADGRFRVTGVPLADHELIVLAAGLALKMSTGHRVGESVELVAHRGDPRRSRRLCTGDRNSAPRRWRRVHPEVRARPLRHPLGVDHRRERTDRRRKSPTRGESVEWIASVVGLGAAPVL